MHRRRVLKVGIGVAALIATAGGGLALLAPGISEGRLSDDGLAVFGAVARAVLDKSLPDTPVQRDAQLQAHLQRLNAAVAAFPPATQRELSQLLALLASAPGRLLLAGLTTAWAKANTAEIQGCLESMRRSPLNLRQQIYHALRDLTNAAYYADPAAWPLMGYPGPVLI
jgi:hypothetical protein